MARSIVLAVETKADPTAVHRALSTAEGLASFWTPSVDGSPDIGETLRFGFEAAPVDLEMEVVSDEAPTRIQWRCAGPWPNWGGTTVGWTLQPAEPGSLIVFRHDGWGDEVSDPEFGSVVYTWALVLQALVAYTESGTPSPALT